MKKILITGAGGFVGSHVVGEELKRGNIVVGIDISPPDKVREYLKHENFTYVQEDILREGVMETYIKDVDLFYHFAAIADPRVYCDDPVKVLHVDLEGSQLAIKLAYEYDVKIVFSSTSEVYGKNPVLPWHELDDRVLGATNKSRWSYATAKAAGEHYCHAYGKRGLRFVILRFFNFYGPKLDFIGGGRVMTCFLEKFFKGEAVNVVKPGSQTRCFTYIDDGIQGVCDAGHFEGAENLIFNLGTQDEISMLSLARLMKKIGGFKSEIAFVDPAKHFGPDYDDIIRRVPDCERARHLLDWKSPTSLEEGIAKTIEYYRGIA